MSTDFYKITVKSSKDHFTNELKSAAFEALLLNPGSERQDWIDNLVENYGIEVVDALGNDPNEVFADLADLWDDVYLDPASGIEKSYSDWAETLCNEQTVDLYYELIERETK